MENIYVFVVVAALGGPLLWLVLRRDFRQSFKRNVRVRKFVIFAFGLFVFLVSTSIFLPLEAKQVLAVSSLAVLVVVIAKARPSYGWWHNLPPGSLSIFNQMDRIDDRFLLKEAAVHGPIFKTTQTCKPTVCVVGIESGAELLRAHDACLLHSSMPFSKLIPHGFIRYMDRSTHARYRPLLAKVLAPEVIDRSLPVAVAVARDELRRLEAACIDERSDGVLLHDHMPSIVLRMFVALFFGVKQDSEEMARFEELYRIVDCRDQSKVPENCARQALGELVDLVRVVAARSSARADRTDRDAGFVRALLEEDPSLIDDETLMGNIVCMVRIGSYDVSGLTLWIWKHLSDHPEWRERLYTEQKPQPGVSEGGLADRIISETLRLEQSEYIKRVSSDVFEFAGFRIPKGWGVRICVRESHRDPASFEEPERFDPDRFLRRDTAPHVYAPFGFGRTNCLARRLTYVAAGALLRELATHYTWTVLQDGPRTHDGSHWAPNKDFRIRLCRRSVSQSSGDLIVSP